MTEPAPDREARRIALNRRASVILEAPAGSGKTSLLVARYLSLLPHVAHPRQVLAVTFTRKAAAEMASRIESALGQARDHPEKETDDSWDARLRNLARTALEAQPEHFETIKSPDGLLVTTFHGFCAAVVRGWPLEAGRAPGLRLLEDLEQDELLDTAVDGLLAEAEAGRLDPETTKALVSRLVATNNSVTVVTSQIRDLLSRRDRLPDLAHAVREITLNPAQAEHRESILTSFFLQPLTLFFGSRTGAWQEIARARAEAGTFFPPHVPGVTPRDLGDWRAAAEAFLTRGESWRGRKSRASFGPRTGFPSAFSAGSGADLIRSLPEEIRGELAFAATLAEAGEPSDARALSDLVLLSAAILDRLRRLQGSTGIDYMELELGALRAFRESSRPSESLIFYHEQLRHLLVDEAQDLNDTQVRLLAALTSGWDSEDGRTLFVVGDPKQSIYRFRRAQVRLFVHLQEKGLPRSGEAHLRLLPLRLEANFRSQPHLVELANQLFPKVFHAPKILFDEVEFSRSVPTRNPGTDPEPVRTAVFSWGQDRTRLAARAREASWVASRVSNLCRQHPDDSIAILLPTRTHLPVFFGELQAAGVSLELLEGQAFLDRPEVRYLVNLLTALLRPFDDLAWAGVLRAPWSRVSLRELSEISSLPEPLWPGKLSAHSSTSALFRTLETARERLGREPYGETLLALWEALSGPRITAGLWGPGAVVNARELFRMIDLLSPALGEELLERLERFLRATYTPPDPRAATSRISMMTIHQAKGLEFHHVVAVGLDRTSRQGGRGPGPAFLVETLPDGSGVAAVARDRRHLSNSLTWAILERLDEERSLAESRRLFYVAATRARESLTLTGLFQRKKKETEEGRDESPICWIVEAFRKGGLRGSQFELLEDPEQEADPLPDRDSPEIPAPAAFNPVRFPYRVESPSRLAEDTALAVRSGEEEPDPEARARGLVIHRLLETLARSRSLPDAGAVEAALSAEGLARESCAHEAEMALREARRAWDLPSFQALRQGAELLPEWSVEKAAERQGEKTIRVGRIDLLLKKPGEIAVIDYKTGRLKEDPASWARRYQAQLRSYADMVSRDGHPRETVVRAFLLLTAEPLLIEITTDRERT